MATTHANEMDRIESSYGTITKRTSNQLRLIDQLDYYGKLSSQLEWQNGDNRPIRIVYTKSGANRRHQFCSMMKQSSTTCFIGLHARRSMKPTSCCDCQQ